MREAFADNFARRRELGGACCAYHRGEKVVDLWGGIRNKQTGEPWEQDTMVIVYSATKGLAAMTLAIAHSRGWLDYEERVCAYWPEFAQQGKEKITVRQLLAHQAGLFALDEPVDRSLVADLDRLAVVLARQKPAWEPGTRQAYHAITLGFYEGELLRRIDPRHRSLGQFFQDEIATPLGLDVYIRLPEAIPNSRLATIARPGPIEMLRGFPPSIHAGSDESPLQHLPGTRGAPSCRTMSSASTRATSRCRPAVPSALRAPSRTPTACSPPADASWGCARRRWTCWPPRRFPRRSGFYDECLKGDGVQFSLGFMKPSAVWPFGSAELVRVTRVRRLSWLCRSERWRRLRLRHEPDGDDVDRRPAGCGAQRRALLLAPEVRDRTNERACRALAATNSPHASFYALWGFLRVEAGESLS